MAFSFTELLKKQFPLAQLGVDTGGSKRMPESSPFPTGAFGALPMGGLIEALGGVTGIPEGAGFKMADLFDNDRWNQVSGSEFGIPENPRRGEVRMTNRYIPREYGADASIMEDQRIAASPTMPYSPPSLQGRNPPIPESRPEIIYKRLDEVNGGQRDITGINPWDAYNQQRSDVGRITAGNQPSNSGRIYDRWGEVNGGLGNADIKEVIKESEGPEPNTKTTTISYGSNAMPAAYMSKGSTIKPAPYQGAPGARLGPNWRGPERYSPQRGFDVNRGFQGANFGALTPYLGRIGTGVAGLLFNSEALGGGMDTLTPESAVDEMMQQQGMQEYNEAQENSKPFKPLRSEWWNSLGNQLKYGLTGNPYDSAGNRIGYLTAPDGTVASPQFNTPLSSFSSREVDDGTYRSSPSFKKEYPTPMEIMLERIRKNQYMYDDFGGA